MRRALWLVPLLAIAALLLLWSPWETLELSRGEGAGHTDRPDGEETFYPPLGEPADDVELRGRPGPPPPRQMRHVRRPEAVWRDWQQQNPTKRRWSGVVLADDGRPIHGAGVYQARKATPARATSVGLGRTSTSPQGRFDLLGYPAAGTVFVVTAGGYLALRRDGNTVQEGEALEFRLERAPRLRVRLLDEAGESVDSAGVKVVQPRRGEWPDLGPDSYLVSPSQFCTTSEEGVADFYFGSLGSVVVIPEIEGLTADPAEQWLPEPRGTVTFTVRAGTHLTVTATRAEGGPVEGPVWVSVCEVGTGLELVSWRSAGTDHVADSDLELPAGLYAVEVTAEGREPVLIAGVELPGSGARVERKVTMGALGRLATLRLEIDNTEEVRTGAGIHRGRTLAPPRLLVRRLDGGWSDLGWRPYSAFRWTQKHELSEVQLRPGTYDLMLSFPVREQTAILSGVTLEPGGRITRSVHPRPAPAVRLYDVLPADLAVRAIRLESAQYGRLPVVGRFLGASLEEASALLAAIHPTGSPNRSKPETGPWLGPYPGLLVVVVDDWSGVTHRFAAR